MWSEKMITPIEVRFTDVDSDNHVNHLAVAEWIAHARVTMIDELVKQYRDEDGCWADIDYVLVKLSIDFRDQIIYPNIIEVQGKILRIGTKSLTTHYLVYIPGRHRKIVAIAECVNVFVDATNSRKGVEIPDKLRKTLDMEVDKWWPRNIE